jgi:para-nitrobenzyl esterase
MRRWIFAVVFITTAAVLRSAPPAIVKIDSGQISGTSWNGVKVFKGIPFAAPPVGDLRWKAPQPVVPWSGVKSADAFAPSACRRPMPPARRTQWPRPRRAKTAST